MVGREACADAKKFTPEFKRDVVTVARRGDLTYAEVAADFDISVESVRRWVCLSR
jgi:transposase-like protein